MSEELDTDDDFYTTDDNESLNDFEVTKETRQATLKSGLEARRRIEDMLENKRLQQLLKNEFED